MAENDVETYYTTTEVEKIRDTYDDLLEQWLDDVFGLNARLSRKQWIDIVSTSGAWIFDST